MAGPVCKTTHRIDPLSIALGNDRLINLWELKHRHEILLTISHEGKCSLDSSSLSSEFCFGSIIDSNIRTIQSEVRTLWESTSCVWNQPFFLRGEDAWGHVQPKEKHNVCINWRRLNLDDNTIFLSFSSAAAVNWSHSSLVIVSSAGSNSSWCLL